MKRGNALPKVFTTVVMSSVLLTSTALSSNVFAKGDANKIYMGQINPEFKNATAKSNSNGKSGYGFIPNPVKITKSTSNKNLLKNANLPAKFDLRDQNKVTSVRNQGKIGSCWACATYSSLESWMLMSQNTDVNYSENNLITHSGFDFGPDDGGNSFMSTAYLSRWNGPVLEKDDPYASPATPSNIVVRDGKKAVNHVQDVLFIPERTGSADNDEIKASVMKYGALDISMAYDKKYYNPSTSSYYAYEDSNTNHDVAIVGWDDNYSKDNFKQAPAGNGAFIVRNSWGPNWGDKGYFYISYYDKCVAKYNAAFINAQPTNNYDKVYEYDPLGMVNVAGFNSETASFANVFKSSLNNEKLSAVSFYTTKENAKYEIYVEPNYETNEFTKLTKIKSGTIDMPGYHTINLDNSISLTNGKKYAVAVKLVEDEEKSPIAIEGVESDYSSKASANVGESFISSDNKNWTDLKESNPELNANVCLKAFTKGDVNTDKTVEVVSTTPSNGAIDVDLNSKISVKFNEAVQKGTGFENITLNDGQNKVSAACTINGDSISISAALKENTKYTLTIPAEAVVGNSGNKFSNPYTMSFTTKKDTNVDPYEPNDSKNTAYPIKLGETYNGYISSPNDIDYYKIKVTKMGILKVNLTNLPADYDLHLYDSLGLPLGHSKLYEIKSKSIKFLVFPRTYYIKVNGNNNNYNNKLPYTLQVNQ
ncbi:hypothetical protein HBE96_03010 [Clostridium sp. P21]|uniref:Peptidase C1A papain C-terminal domain-containing protein n=1 Tax=Clostridium muellerianum TaxID=2716538 RepID=A0A7Y0EDU6_9CLOT|nr:lectin like domain-containing protein [Clostridium muellerianum]NMM61676.1 hypothetical protein [Clostridium muellerianum]